MDDQRVGRIVRALRRRLGWRQIDLARRAACAQATVSETERGHLPSVPILRRILAALDAHLVVEVRWRAGELDRLLDADHAMLGALVARLLGEAGWEVRIEVTYNEFGERGSIDLLAFMPATGTLLVLEIKTDMAAVEQTLRKLDETAGRCGRSPGCWSCLRTARCGARSRPTSRCSRRRSPCAVSRSGPESSSLLARWAGCGSCQVSLTAVVSERQAVEPGCGSRNRPHRSRGAMGDGRTGSRVGYECW
ncbi:MAG: helix-turn-helix domain-containing protein [Chloroflexota bacterium]|nr:helix-turn-helix domain-containing protein [Chloroflexota bacterium]